MGVLLHECICVKCVSGVSQRIEEGSGSPTTGGADGRELPCRHRECSLYPTEGQRAHVTTEPSLQPCEPLGGPQFQKYAMSSSNFSKY